MTEYLTTKSGTYTKVNVWLGEELAREVADEARRLGRSQGWVIKRCVKCAARRLRQLPSVPTVPTVATTQPCAQEG